MENYEDDNATVEAHDAAEDELQARLVGAGLDLSRSIATDVSYGHNIERGSTTGLDFVLRLKDGEIVVWTGGTHFVVDLGDGVYHEVDYDISQMPRFEEEIDFIERVVHYPVIEAMDALDNVRDRLADAA